MELPVNQQCLQNGMGPRRFELLTSAVRRWQGVRFRKRVSTVSIKRILLGVSGYDLLNKGTTRGGMLSSIVIEKASFRVPALGQR